MYTVQVVLCTRSIASKELTYYSAVAYPIGSVLVVPVRTSTQQAVVVVVQEVRVSKAALRSAQYSLHRLPKQEVRIVLSPEFIRASRTVAAHYAAPQSAVLMNALPKALLTLESSTVSSESANKPRLRGFIVPRLYQGQTKDRVEFYRTAVREAFAAHGSVFLLAPTIADAERLYKSLAPGVDRYAYLLHSSLPLKEQRRRLDALLANSHPVLLVSTPAYLGVPRHDLATIIVEREGSSVYTARERPYVDMRMFAHELAAELGGQLYLADLPLRIESVYRKDVGEYEEVVTGHHRMQFDSVGTLISLRGEGREPKRPFYAIGRELLTRIHETTQRGGNTFLYVARRGLSPVTLCADCGTAVTCHECSASVALHQGRDENHFLCHACGAMRHARERCTSCRSWRLETFGVGTELVEREVRERVPGAQVQVLSSDTAKSHTSAQTIARAFYAQQSGVLVGTELALPYLTERIPLVGVVSLDALLSIASFTVYERITSTVTRLRELTYGEFVVQTRHPDEQVLQHALAGNFSGFYRSELRARKAMGYPPYTTLIKVSIAGHEQEVGARMEEACKILEPYELVVYPRVLRGPKGVFLSHGFLRVPRESWPDVDLAARLRALPPSCVVHIDPESIL